eukprot:TRINITY_DN991_c0_g1_i9.p1 TRINITY_DN991_c0_g1~~TRINITY_DN991_c0_g1_i9.p1  ORF type:complete len:1470 (+),score=411.21 TRINITY_DN991_c0_g1_i9:4947-9356(+)
MAFRERSRSRASMVVSSELVIQSQEEGDQNFIAVVDGSKAILMETRNLIDLVLSDQMINEDEIVEAAKRAAMVTYQLGAFVSKLPVTAAMMEHATALASTTKVIRASVLELIKAARSVWSNKLDFLSRQTLDQCRVDVVNGIKKVIQLCDEMMSGGDEEEEEEVDEEIQAGIQAFIVCAKQVSQSMVELLASVKPPEANPNYIDSNPATQRYDKRQQEFLARTKVFLDGVNKMVLVARTTGDPPSASLLRETALALVKAGRDIVAVTLNMGTQDGKTGEEKEASLNKATTGFRQTLRDLISEVTQAAGTPGLNVISPRASHTPPPPASMTTAPTTPTTPNTPTRPSILKTAAPGTAPGPPRVTPNGELTSPRGATVAAGSPSLRPVSFKQPATPPGTPPIKPTASSTIKPPSTTTTNNTTTAEPPSSVEAPPTADDIKNRRLSGSISASDAATAAGRNPSLNNRRFSGPLGGGLPPTPSPASTPLPLPPTNGVLPSPLSLTSPSASPASTPTLRPASSSTTTTAPSSTKSTPRPSPALPTILQSPPLDLAPVLSEAELETQRRTVAEGIMGLLTAHFPSSLGKEWLDITMDARQEVISLVANFLAPLPTLPSLPPLPMELPPPPPPVFIPPVITTTSSSDDTSSVGSADDDDDAMAMRELQKIMMMKNSQEWGMMSVAVRSLGAKLQKRGTANDGFQGEVVDVRDIPADKVSQHAQTTLASLSECIADFNMAVNSQLDTIMQEAERKAQDAATAAAEGSSSTAAGGSDHVNKSESAVEGDPEYVRPLDRLLSTLQRFIALGAKWRLEDTSSGGGTASNPSSPAPVHAASAAPVSSSPVVEKQSSKSSLKTLSRSSPGKKALAVLGEQATSDRPKTPEEDRGRIYKALVSRILTQSGNQLEMARRKGVALPRIVSLFSGSGSGLVSVLRIQEMQLMLQDRVNTEAKALRALIAQIISAGNAFVSESPPDYTSHCNLLQIEGGSRSLLQSSQNLIDALETLRYLHSLPLTALTMATTGDDELKGTDVNIWMDEGPGAELAASDSAHLRGGTINAIVKRLTSDTLYDSKFVATCIATYRTFTTPWRLWTKLLERYNMPESLPEKTKQAVQARVCVVLKYWIENQFADFDSALVEVLTKFIRNRLPNDKLDTIANVLEKLIETKKEEATIRTRAFIVDPFAPLQITQDRMSPYRLFMELNESEIARQLTLIEFDLFSRIAPSELCNQAWSKPKLQHQAPHILAMIARANHLSYWVASLLLWAPTQRERSDLLTRFIRIGQHLHELKNFNTMMSVVAGINMSPVHRLQQTFKMVDASARATLDNLQQLLQPTGSFKSYREALSKSQPPCLPYLGTYLTDLTFMEDGNPDLVYAPSATPPPIEKKSLSKKSAKALAAAAAAAAAMPADPSKQLPLINLAKRELVYGVMREIRMYQDVRYRFPVVEPVSTFMVALPFWDEKDLYELSLQREARATS